MGESPTIITSLYNPNTSIECIGWAEGHPCSEELIVRLEISIGLILVPPKAVRATPWLDGEVRGPDQEPRVLAAKALAHHGHQGRMPYYLCCPSSQQVEAEDPVSPYSSRNSIFQASVFVRI